MVWWFATAHLCMLQWKIFSQGSEWRVNYLGKPHRCAHVSLNRQVMIIEYTNFVSGKNIFSKNTTATTKFSNVFKKIDQRSEGTFFYDVSVLPPDHQKIITSTSLTGIAVVQVFYKNLKLSLQVFTNHRNLWRSGPASSVTQKNLHFNIFGTSSPKKYNFPQKKVVA